MGNTREIDEIIRLTKGGEIIWRQNDQGITSAVWRDFRFELGRDDWLTLIYGNNPGFTLELRKEDVVEIRLAQFITKDAALKFKQLSSVFLEVVTNEGVTQ